MVVPSRISSYGRVWARWPWLQKEGSRAYHETILQLFKQKPCDVAVIDGILAMQGSGPVGGEAVRMGVVLAGFDPVAVDAVACTLMNIDPQEVGYLFLIDAEGLGTVNMSIINVPPLLVTEQTRSFDRSLDVQETLVAWRDDK